MFGHFEPVNHCCFSPDDTYVSTSSNDGTIKVSTMKLDMCKVVCQTVLGLCHLDVKFDIRAKFTERMGFTSKELQWVK